MTRLTVSKEEALPVLEYLFCSNNKKGIGTRRFLACVPLEQHLTVFGHVVSWLLTVFAFENLLAYSLTVADELVAVFLIEIMASKRPFPIVRFVYELILLSGLLVQLCAVVVGVYLVLNLTWVTLKRTDRIDHDDESRKEGKFHI